MAFNIKEFKEDLRAVLEKHNVTLGVNIDGDTHGIQIEGFVAYDNKTHEEHVLEEYSPWLDASDLKE